MLTIYQEMKAAGVEGMGSWQSDLYVPVTDVTTKIVDAYEFKCNVKTFQSQIEGEGRYYDIPFAYDPYHTKEKNWMQGFDTKFKPYRVVRGWKAAKCAGEQNWVGYLSKGLQSRTGRIVVFANTLEALKTHIYVTREYCLRAISSLKEA